MKKQSCSRSERFLFSVLIRVNPSRIFCGLAIAILTARVRADTVLTADGKLLDGLARIEGDGITVVQRTAGNVHVELPRIISAQFDSPAGSAPAARARQVVLANGSAVAFDEVMKLTEQSLRVKRPGGAVLELLTGTVARVVFDPAARAAFPSGDGMGALLRSGDFVEGEAITINGGRLNVSSTLFGERGFDLGRDVVAIRLRASASPRAAYVVRLANGTVARSPTLRVEGDRLIFEDPTAGPLTAGRDEVRALTGGADRLSPLQLNGPPLVSGVAPKLRAAAPWEGGGPAIGVQAGAEREVTLPAGAGAVFLRAGVPSGLLPVQQVRFIVLVDGQRVFRSAPLSSVDDPITIALPVAGKHKLTLRVEAEGNSLGAEGVFADGVVVSAK